MELFTYLMAKNDHNTSVKKDLFSYLLGKNQSGTYQEYTGTSLSINNTKKGKMKVDLYGNTSQVTYTGKNLISTESQSATGLNIVVQDNGTLLVNGTLSAAAYDTTANYDTTLPVGTYTLSIYDNAGNKYAGDFYVSSTYYYKNPNSDLTFTTTEVGTHLRLILYLPAKTYTNVVISIQLESGSTKTSYEQYCGGTASPNPSYPQIIHSVSGDNTINVVGKNMYIGSSDFSGTWEASNKWETDSNTYNGCVVKKRAGSWDGLCKTINVVSGKTYTFSLYAKADESRSCAFYLSNFVSPTSQDVTLTTEWTRYSVTFTANANTTVRPRLENKTASTTNYTYVACYQLEEANEMSDYEKTQSYQLTLDSIELNKIGTYQDYFLKNSGKNLFDKDSQDILKNVRIGADGGNNADSGYFISEFIEVTPNTKYTKNTTADAYHRFAFYTDKSTNSFISKSEDNTITTPSNAKYLRICGLITEKGSIQLEKGTTATSYEPYGNGEWYLKKEIGKVVLDGSFADAGQTNVFYTANITDYATSNNVPLSNYYNGVSNVVGSSGMNTQPNNTIAFINISGGTTPRFYVKDTRYNSSSDFNNWLANNNLVVNYALATPTYTQITDDTLISQLEAVHNAKSYKDQTNINQVNDDLPFELKVKVKVSS